MKEKSEKMPFSIGGGVSGEIGKAKKIDKVGASIVGGENSARPIKSGVKDSGMIPGHAKVSPTKPSGKRLDQWMDKRNKDCERK